MSTLDDSAPTSRVKKRVRAVLRAPLLHFFVLGFALLLGQRALGRATQEPQTLRVVVPTGLTEAERELRVDAAILIEEGLALGWARTDPVIRARLIANLRFARGESLGADADASANANQEESGARDRGADELTPGASQDEQDAPRGARDDDDALLEEALRLDMQRSDLIVRRRLVSRAERLLTSDVRNAPVADDELLAFRDAHPERFRAPARYQYADLFLSRQRHGDGLDEAARAMRARLTAEQVAPEQATALSDPLLYAPGQRWVSADEVQRRLGGALAEHLADAPMGTWAGPYESSFGLHFVWVRERREAALPSLDVARARILGAYRDARQAEAIRARMAELRAQYDIVVEERDGAP